MHLIERSWHAMVKGSVGFALAMRPTVGEGHKGASLSLGWGVISPILEREGGDLCSPSSGVEAPDASNLEDGVGGGGGFLFERFTIRVRASAASPERKIWGLETHARGVFAI
jgi:hypothetical protein